MQSIASPHTAELKQLGIEDIPSYAANLNRGGMKTGQVVWAIFDKGDFEKIGHSATAVRYTWAGLEDCRNVASAIQSTRNRDMLIVEYTCP